MSCRDDFWWKWQRKKPNKLYASKKFMYIFFYLNHMRANNKHSSAFIFNVFQLSFTSCQIQTFNEKRIHFSFAIFFWKELFEPFCSAFTHTFIAWIWNEFWDMWTHLSYQRCVFAGVKAKEKLTDREERGGHNVQHWTKIIIFTKKQITVRCMLFVGCIQQKWI